MLKNHIRGKCVVNGTYAMIHFPLMVSRFSVGAGVGLTASSCVMMSAIAACVSRVAFIPQLVPYTAFARLFFKSSR